MAFVRARLTEYGQIRPLIRGGQTHSSGRTRIEPRWVQLRSTWASCLALQCSARTQWAAPVALRACAAPSHIQPRRTATHTKHPVIRRASKYVQVYHSTLAASHRGCTCNIAWYRLLLQSLMIFHVALARAHGSTRTRTANRVKASSQDPASSTVRPYGIC